MGLIPSCKVNFFFGTCASQHLRQVLKDAWALYVASKSAESQTVGAFGRLCVRVCLHVLNKEKAGREPDGFEDLQQIAGKFAEDLQGMAHMQAEASASSTDIQVSNVLSASKAELALLQNKHIKVGEMHPGVSCKFV